MDKFQDEVSYYTINGEVLDNRNRVLYDLTGIRIHMIDHVFDEKEVYDYVKGQIGKTREDIDEGKELEAAARVISMQLLLGIDVKMKSAVQDIKDGVISLPEEYNTSALRSVISSRLSGDVNKELLEDGKFIPRVEDSMLRGSM